MCRKTSNNINFCYRTNSIKANYQIFRKFKKLIFKNLWTKNFPKHLALSHTFPYGFLAPCQMLQETNDVIPTKQLDRQKDARTDRPSFLGPFAYFSSPKAPVERC